MLDRESQLTRPPKHPNYGQSGIGDVVPVLTLRLTIDCVIAEEGKESHCKKKHFHHSRVVSGLPGANPKGESREWIQELPPSEALS